MDGRIRAAFRAAPRERFLPLDKRHLASVDAPISIGFGVTNPQPSTVAPMLELLDVHEGQLILDVGSGSGWTTALLAELVGPTGRVVGVERIWQLVERAHEALADWPWAGVQLAVPGVLGVPDQAGFDRILVSAMANELPVELVTQLGDSGVLVIPVAGEMLRVVRHLDDEDVVTSHGWYSFVPLIR